MMCVGMSVIHPNVTKFFLLLFCKVAETEREFIRMFYWDLRFILFALVSSVQVEYLNIKELLKDLDLGDNEPVPSRSAALNFIHRENDCFHVLKVHGVLVLLNVPSSLCTILIIRMISIHNKIRPNELWCVSSF